MAEAKACQCCKVSLPESPQKFPTPPSATSYNHNSWERTVIAILDSRAITWLPYIAFAFITYNAVEALRRARDEPWTAAFVVGAYVNLLLLYWCLTEFEKVKEQNNNTPRKERLKVGIWTLAVTLNLMFSYRVTVIADSLAMSVVVWTVAALTAVGGLYGIFCCTEQNPTPAPSAAVSAPANKV